MKNFDVWVRVKYKEGILDPQADTVFKALQQLQFKLLKGVACEKIFRLDVEAESDAEALKQGRDAAQKLLTNIVMEDFEVTLGGIHG